MRHGQTDWNAGNKRMGQRDVPLNEVGRLQAEATKHIIARFPITHVYHSPLQRAHETMKIATELLECEKVVHDLLKEWFLGEWEGTKNMIDDGGNPPGGESEEEFFTRSVQAVNHILTLADLPLIVGHSGTYLALKRRLDLLHLPKIRNCEIAHFIPPKGERKEWLVQIISTRLEDDE